MIDADLAEGDVGVWVPLLLGTPDGLGPRERSLHIRADMSPRPSEESMITLSELENAAYHGLPWLPLIGGLAAASLRLAAGATATACAAAVGLSEKSWTRYEHGSTRRFASHALDL